MSATVIIPTTGAPELMDAINSALNQTYITKCYVVCDGDKYLDKVHEICEPYGHDDRFQVCYLPENVGANGFYGHRVYAAFTHLLRNCHLIIRRISGGQYQRRHQLATLLE